VGIATALVRVRKKIKSPGASPRTGIARTPGFGSDEKEKLVSKFYQMAC